MLSQKSAITIRLAERKRRVVDKRYMNRSLIDLRDIRNSANSVLIPAQHQDDIVEVTTAKNNSTNQSSSNKTHLDLLIKKLEHNVDNKMKEISLLKKNQTIVINSNNPLNFGPNLEYFDTLPLKIDKMDSNKIEKLWYEIERQ